MVCKLGCMGVQTKRDNTKCNKPLNMFNIFFSELCCLPPVQKHRIESLMLNGIADAWQFPRLRNSKGPTDFTVATAWQVTKPAAVVPRKRPAARVDTVEPVDAS